MSQKSEVIMVSIVDDFATKLQEMSSGAAAWKLPAKAAQTVLDWASYITPWRDECRSLSGRVKEISAPLILPIFISKVFKFNAALSQAEGAANQAKVVATAGADCIEKGAALAVWLQKAQLFAIALPYVRVLKVVGAIAGMVNGSVRLLDGGINMIARDCSNATILEFVKCALGFAIAALTLLTLVFAFEAEVVMLILGSAAFILDFV